LKDEIAPLLGDQNDAWAVIAQAAGAVLIARAMATEATRAQVLQSAEANIAAILDK